jgi:hypothetical protein
MNMNREKTVNTKATSIGYGPTIGDMRLSRLSHPRATLMAMVLLAVVFLLFGMFANAVEPAYTPAPNTINGAMTLIGDWVLDCASVRAS